jgi:hypothetical protein
MIIRRADGQVVGKVERGVFSKHVSGRQHQLRRPPAWCCDLSILDQAEAAGAEWIEICDGDTGRTWRARTATWRARGFCVNRGHGQQVGLCLSEFDLDKTETLSGPQLALGV